MARKLLVLLLLLGLAPGLWWRSQAPPPGLTQGLQVTPLRQARGQVGELDLRGAWLLDSANPLFGGYSALVVLDGGRLLAASDRGDYLEFPRPGHGGPIRLGRLDTHGADRKWLSDIEALTRDPPTGTLWAALEGRNMIVRYRPDLVATGDATPPQIRDWSYNSGPEAMERLADGRFLMLAEGAMSGLWGRHEAVLFAGDPVEGASGTQFTFVAPDGYSPVDLAQIPDGRVLVLLRRVVWTLPLTFDVALMLADPGQIAEGAEWHGRIVARFGDIVPNGNYEGLAVAPGEDGTLSLWVIADDNVSALQETYLLHFAWDPRGPE